MAREQMEAIDAEIESKIEDGTIKLALVGSATSEAIYNLLIVKGIITGEELSEAFYDSLEDKIKNFE